jgi:quinoprotein glucose dehydrogenase
VVDDPETGSILRCNPDGSGFEVFATGVRNPQELAFDDLGNLFTGDNNSDSGDKARFVHLVEGGDSGWRMAFQYLPDRGPWNRELLWDEKEGHKAKYIIPPIANVGNGPSGLTYNPGTALGERYKGRFFLSDFRGGAGASVVHEIALEPAGAGFKLKERRDFLKGVLTTDGEFGNDGAFYVLDWVESWGGTGKGRIYRLSDPSGVPSSPKACRNGPMPRSSSFSGIPTSGFAFWPSSLWLRKVPRCRRFSPRSPGMFTNRFWGGSTRFGVWDSWRKKTPRFSNRS